MFQLQILQSYCYVFICVCVCVRAFSAQSLSGKDSDGLWEEAVAQSGSKRPNASVALARWQEGKAFV